MLGIAFGLGKAKGILFTTPRFSHLVVCCPYSKSVSIRDSGVETRSLFVGSNKISVGVKVVVVPVVEVVIGIVVSPLKSS
jgi:hypothetical protein